MSRDPGLITRASSLHGGVPCVATHPPACCCSLSLFLSSARRRVVSSSSWCRFKRTDRPATGPLPVPTGSFFTTPTWSWKRRYTSRIGVDSIPESRSSGCQTQLDCAGYVNDSPGQLTAVRATYEGNYVPFQMGVDESREDYLFYFYGEGRFSACSDNCACSNGPGPSVVGRHACMSATLSGGTADDGSRFYLNHFSFYVPPGALGTYVVGLAEQDTNIATATQEALLPANFTPLRIEVATGACCVPQESQTECLETTRKPCRDMGGIWVEGCSCDPDDWNFVCCWDFECGTDAHCADGDGCTINRCAIGDLDYMPPFCQDPIPIELGAGECCDPSVEMGSLADTDGLGAIAPLDDGNDCTEGYCDAPGTCALGDQCGAVQQSSAAAYTPCDTEEPCMTDGVCDGEGICLAHRHQHDPMHAGRRLRLPGDARRPVRLRGGALHMPRGHAAFASSFRMSTAVSTRRRSSTSPSSRAHGPSR